MAERPKPPFACPHCGSTNIVPDSDPYCTTEWCDDCGGEIQKEHRTIQALDDELAALRAELDECEGCFESLQDENGALKNEIERLRKVIQNPPMVPMVVRNHNEEAIVDTIALAKLAEPK